MKSAIAFLSMFACVASSIQAEEEIIPCEKTYVNPDQVQLSEQALFVNIGDVWVQPTAIQVDANGLFFNAYFNNVMPDEVWQCKCRFWNKPWAEYCKNCGRRRGAKQ